MIGSACFRGFLDSLCLLDPSCAIHTLSYSCFALMHNLTTLYQPPSCLDTHLALRVRGYAGYYYILMYRV